MPLVTFPSLLLFFFPLLLSPLAVSPFTIHPPSTHPPAAIIDFTPSDILTLPTPNLYSTLITPLTQNHNFAVLQSPPLLTLTSLPTHRKSHESVLKSYLSTLPKPHPPIISLSHSMGCGTFLLRRSSSLPPYAGHIFCAFNNYPLTKAIPFGEGIRGVKDWATATEGTGKRKRKDRHTLVWESLHTFSSSNSISSSSHYFTSSEPECLIVQYGRDHIDQSNELYRGLKEGGRRNIGWARVEDKGHMGLLNDGDRIGGYVGKILERYYEGNCIGREGGVQEMREGGRR